MGGSVAECSNALLQSEEKINEIKRSRVVLPGPPWPGNTAKEFGVMLAAKLLSRFFANGTGLMNLLQPS